MQCTTLIDYLIFWIGNDLDVIVVPVDGNSTARDLALESGVVLLDHVLRLQMTRELQL